MYIVLVITWIANKHILQQFIFVFREMSLCMIHNHKRHQLRYNPRHKNSVCLFILYLPIKFDIPRSNGSLVITIKWKDTQCFHTTAILYHILEKHKLCFLTIGQWQWYHFHLRSLLRVYQINNKLGQNNNRLCFKINYMIMGKVKNEFNKIISNSLKWWNGGYVQKQNTSKN